MGAGEYRLGIFNNAAIQCAPVNDRPSLHRPQTRYGLPIFAPLRSEIDMRSSAANVYLVGAGPGDAGLITVRGATLLDRADVIIYDALVNPRLLGRCPPLAEKIFVGKR